MFRFVRYWMGDRFGEIWGIFFLLYCRINSAKFWHFLLIFLLRWLNSANVPVHCYTNTTEYCRESMLYCWIFEFRFLSVVKLIILFINLCSQNNSYDLFQDYQQGSFWIFHCEFFSFLHYKFIKIKLLFLIMYLKLRSWFWDYQ